MEEIFTRAQNPHDGKNAKKGGDGATLPESFFSASDVATPFFCAPVTFKLYNDAKEKVVLEMTPEALAEAEAQADPFDEDITPAEIPQSTRSAGSLGYFPRATSRPSDRHEADDEDETAEEEAVLSMVDDVRIETVELDSSAEEADVEAETEAETEAEEAGGGENGNEEDGQDWLFNTLQADRSTDVEPVTSTPANSRPSTLADVRPSTSANSGPSTSRLSRSSSVSSRNSRPSWPASSQTSRRTTPSLRNRKTALVA